MWLTLHAAKSTAPSDKGALITEQDLFIRQGMALQMSIKRKRRKASSTKFEDKMARIDMLQQKHGCIKSKRVLAVQCGCTVRLSGTCRERGSLVSRATPQGVGRCCRNAVTLCCAWLMYRAVCGTFNNI